MSLGNGLTLPGAPLVLGRAGTSVPVVLHGLIREALDNPVQPADSFLEGECPQGQNDHKEAAHVHNDVVHEFLSVDQVSSKTEQTNHDHSNAQDNESGHYPIGIYHTTEIGKEHEQHDGNAKDFLQFHHQISA